MLDPIALHLTDWLLRASLVFAVAWLATLVLGRASAALRSGVWRAAFACAAALPLVGALAPPLRWLPAPSEGGDAAAAHTNADPVRPAAALALAGAEARGDATPETESADVARTGDAEVAPAAAGPAGLARPRVDSTALLVLGWLSGAALALVGLVRGLGRARRIVRAARPASASFDGARVVVSDAPEAPFVLDPRPFARPVVVLSDRDRGGDVARAVALHEGQHLARRDGAWFLFARVAAALLWPTPFAWLALRRLRVESERACDDAVLRGGVRASDYAADLVGRAAASPLPVPAMASGARASLSERVEALVAARADRRALGARARALVALAASGLVVPLASVERAAATPQAVVPPARDGGAAQDPRAATAADGRDAAVDAAWARGLTALVALQDPATGAWKGDVGYKLNHSWRAIAEDVPHVATTALAVEALLFAGQRPGDGPYGEALERAVAWLLSTQGEDGFFSAHSSRLRPHGQALAALSLALAAGADVPFEALRRAADYSVAARAADGSGWRFVAGANDVDILETAHHLYALETSRIAFARALGVDDFGRWSAALDRATGPAYAFVRGLRVGAGEHAPAGAYRYQPGSHARVTDNTTAAGLFAQSASELDGWSESLAAFDALRLRSSVDPEQRDGHFLTWDAELLAGRAAGGPSLGRRTAMPGHEEACHRFRDAQRARILTRAADDGRWPCVEGPGDAYTTAIACLLLAGE